jgi:hypothetical protein
MLIYDAREAVPLSGIAETDVSARVRSPPTDQNALGHDGLSPLGPVRPEDCCARPRVLARFFSRCAPRIVDTHAPLPQDLSKGAITTEQASSVPLQRSSLFSIVHM